MTDNGKRGQLTLAYWGVLALPCLGLLGFVARNYVLMPYSDPANWLHLARQLTESDTPHRFPIVYPVYLRLMLTVTGPFYIFFANIPWLISMLALTGVATYHMLRPTRDRQIAALGALLAMFFLLASGRHLWVMLANPYRDPLAHTLLLGAIALLFAAFRVTRPRRNYAYIAGADMTSYPSDSPGRLK